MTPSWSLLQSDYISSLPWVCYIVLTFDPCPGASYNVLTFDPFLEPLSTYLHYFDPILKPPPPRNILTFDPFLEPPHSLPTFILGQQCLTLVAISLFNTKKFKMLHILHSFFIVILVFNSFKRTSRRKQNVCQKTSYWCMYTYISLIEFTL